MATEICPWCGKTVDKFIMFRGDIVGCRYCGIHTKQTNADRLRAMSDEELAKWLDLLVNRAKIYGENKVWLEDTPRYYTDWLDWLRQEARE